MKSINQSVSIKTKELKILNYYKNLGELSNKGLDKTKPIKRTKKKLQSSLINKNEEKINKPEPITNPPTILLND